MYRPSVKVSPCRTFPIYSTTSSLPCGLFPRSVIIGHNGSDARAHRFVHVWCYKLISCGFMTTIHFRCDSIKKCCSCSISTDQALCTILPSVASLVIGVAKQFCIDYSPSFVISCNCLLKYLSMIPFSGSWRQCGHLLTSRLTLFFHSAIQSAQKCWPQHSVRKGSCKTSKQIEQ